MKAKILIITALLLTGCVKNSPSVEKDLKTTEIEKKIIEHYQISKKALAKAGENYAFFLPDANGIAIFILDKNYNLLKKKVIPQLIEGKKLLYKNNKIYLLGYDQKENRPLILTLDTNLNIISKKYIGNKFDIPQDFFIKEKPVVLLTTYKNKADIEIVEGDKNYLFQAPDNELGKVIKPFNGGIIIIGSIQHPQEDLFITFIKNGKIVWSKTYDFGLEDSPVKVEIKNQNIEIEVLSQDYMGAEKTYYITVDKNGTIIKHKKGLEFKELPLRFRT